VTIVLAAVAGAALMALLATVLAWRSASRKLLAADARAGEAAEASERLSVDLEAERVRTEEVEARLRDTEGRLGEAERRVKEAEARVVEAARLADELSSPGGIRPALSSGEQADGDGVLAELQRVRIEREWKEVAGPDAPLPVVWDGSVEVALAIELEIIREVTGTPSRLELQRADGQTDSGEWEDAGASEPSGDDGFATNPWTIGGLGCEMLRVVARYADELVVTLTSRQGGLGVSAEAIGSPSSPDLAAIEEAAKAIGLTVTCEQSGDGFVVQLRRPG
jgi:hypothetical protein